MPASARPGTIRASAWQAVVQGFFFLNRPLSVFAAPAADSGFFRMLPTAAETSGTNTGLVVVP